ncbi:hypothetical protein BGZ61DRAFT_538050 [Ilyonectria robusta]|uniref:uncharacterized protein n=1 Tax=Ilyonectria robusta TaxID=1079257 RepID=UPI001E8ED29D|nr:uncharacterized protein BGZ61DRAFT_538050 [Ilyonectria robusta]KAH8667881.1 hypothetical protein BGZ61DRAFT_538050 [Ilyonectria robusta]
MDSMSVLAILLFEIASGSHGPDVLSQIRDIVISIAEEAHVQNEHTHAQQHQRNLLSSIQGLGTLAQQITDPASAGSAVHQASQDAPGPHCHAIEGVSNPLGKVAAASSDNTPTSEALAAKVGVPRNESISMDLKKLKESIASRLDGLDSKVAQLPNTQHLRELLSERLDQILSSKQGEETAKQSTNTILKLGDAKTEFETSRQGVKAMTRHLEAAMDSGFANLQGASTKQHKTVAQELDRLRNRVDDLSLRNHEDFDAQAHTLTEAVINAVARSWQELDGSRSQELQIKLSVEQAANEINATLVSRRDETIRELEDTITIKERELEASATELAQKEFEIRNVQSEAAQNASQMEKEIRGLRDELSKVHEQSEQARLAGDRRIQELEEQAETALNTLSSASKRDSQFQEDQTNRIRVLRDQIDRAEYECDRALTKRDMAYMERDDALVQRNDALMARDDAVADRNNAFGELDNALDERDDAITERNEAIEERKVAIMERKEALADRDKALAELDAMRNAPDPTPQTTQPPQHPSTRKRHRLQESIGGDVTSNLSQAYLDISEQMRELSVVPSPSIRLDVKSLAMEIAPMFASLLSKKHMEEFLGNDSSKWHCLRDVCRRGMKSPAKDDLVCTISGHHKCIFVKSVDRLGTRMLDFQDRLQ